MKLSDYINTEELMGLIEKKLVSRRDHPRFPLSILNYTAGAQSLKPEEWTKTLRRCRGLIYEHGTQELIARGFEKFWNYEDERFPETLPQNLPPHIPLIFEKIDGSLGIGFRYKNEFIIATRGSFESEQAKWATGWALQNLDTSLLQEGWTYLFEIVYPEDRKVVSYGWRGLVLLGSIDKENQEYQPYLAYANEEGLAKCKLPIQYSFTSLEKLAAEKLDNFEGFVAVWYFYPDAIRVKIKLEEYKILHKMYFQTSALSVWEAMKNDQGMDLDRFDKAFRDWVVSIQDSIHLKRSELMSEAFWNYSNCMLGISDNEKQDPDVRKKFALKATQYKNASLLFSLYDGRIDQFHQQLWKLVRPVSVFWKTEET